MKGLVILFAFVLATNGLFAQNCTVTVDPSPVTILCGQEVELTATGLSTTPVFTEDFNNNSFGPGWVTTGTVIYNNLCGPNLDGTPSMWFGNGPLPRRVTTTGFDLSCGGEVCFEIDYSQDENQFSFTECDDPDDIDEGVYFQYRANGGPWITIFYFEPDKFNSAPWYEWSNYCFTIPPGAWSTNTQFRWTQPNATANIYDHWGLDNIVITPAPCNYWYDWDNLPPNVDPAAQTVSPTTTTTYQVVYTDGIDSCSTDVIVNVDPYDVSVTAGMSPLDCGNCTDLAAELTNIPTDTCEVFEFDSGSDMNTNVSINYSSCGPAGSQVLTVLMDGTIANVYGNTTSCGTLFDFDVVIDGTTVLTNQCDIVGLDLSPYMPFSQVRLEANDLGSSTFVLLGLRLYTVYHNPPTVNYSWTPTTGVANPTNANTQVCPPATTTYVGTITDPISGCTGEDSVTIVVNSTTDATITQVGPFCTGDAALNLTSVDPGGTWTGTGITNGTNGTFDPATAGPGTHEIIYTIGAPCPGADTIDIVVNQSLDATITGAGPFCVGDPALNLSAVDPGGTWTGTGITNATNGTFDPSAAGPGTHTITYTISGTCGDVQTTDIVVIDLADATWTAPTGLCTSSAPVDLSALITGTTGGTFSGTGITGNNFDPSVGTQTITYTVGTAPCDDALALQITVIPQADATWSAPTNLCTSSAPVDLSALITGTTGGTFSGTGITGNNFDPSVGTQTITYTVGTAPCDATLALQITVTPQADATWSAPTNLCTSSAPVDLSALITGTTGGTFTGTGITGNNFDPSVGTQTITYTVGTAPCDATLALQITVTPQADATWSAPTNLCTSSAPVDLSTLITGTTGGTFSGTGITGSNFDPSVGTQTITYTVGTAPCDATLALQITVTPQADATWSVPTNLCTSSTPVDLSTLITGTTGGTFTGTGITGNNFDPSVGTQTITYTVGTAPCDATLALQITVTPQADATWSVPTNLCTSSAPVDLSTLITGTTGGTFSGTGITGNNFDPSVGTQTITYTVGTAPCDATLALQITVTPQADATWTIPTGLCTSSAPIDLTTLITGTTGGTFSGIGVTGNMFDPSGGTQTITYMVGTAPCNDVLAQQITITPQADANWTVPTGLCTSSAPVDLSALVTGTTGGTFTGTGITGNNFDPSVGTQTITYTVGTAPCDATLALQITVVPQADASWTLPTGLCTTGAPIDLSMFITGNTGGTFSGTGITGNFFDPSVGTQTITYTVGTAPCDGTLTQQITVDLPLSAGLDSTTTICGTNPSIVDLNTLLNGADLGGTWMETSASGQFNAGTGQFTLTGLAEGLYTFTYTQNANSNCALDVATITINYGVIGNAGIDGQVVVCQDNGLIDLFSLISGNPDAGGIWTPQTTAGNGIFDPSVDNSGTYNYTVYSSAFCPQDTSKAIIDIVNLANIQIIGPNDLCISSGQQGYTASVPNGTWSGQGISNQGILNPSGLNAGGSTTITYTIDSLGCQSSTDFTIALNDIPTIEIFYDGELCEDGEQFISPNVTNANSYYWSDGETDLNRVIEGDYSLIDQTIQLTLTAENDCGLANEVVTINVNQCNETVYVPNAFTPDGDEFNQTFKPVLTGIDVHSYQMVIFNRWGELIFETNNPEVGWDGTYGGTLVQDGMYTWSLQYKLPNEDGNTRLVGHVNVIR